MAKEKEFQIRQQQKHDTTANWKIAGEKGFIPKLAEFIVYDPISASERPRVKLGDGLTPVHNLPFFGESNSALEGLPLSEGNGAPSLVFGDAKANGNYSLAGGTNNKSIVAGIVGSTVAQFINIPETSANGEVSFVFGAGAIAHSTGSRAYGASSQAGYLGYYFYAIDFSTRKITLSKSQLTYAKPTKLTQWKVGDNISIVNNVSYPMCCKIVSIDANNGIIQVDKLPFESIDDPQVLAPNDRAVIAIPPVSQIQIPILGVAVQTTRTIGVGEVEFGFGAVSDGFDNIAAGPVSAAFGFRNTAIDTAAFVTGRENIGGWGSFVGGYKNQVLGGTSSASGRENILTGENSFASGKGNSGFGISCHLEGTGSIIHANFGHAEGQRNVVGVLDRGADFPAGHAEGMFTFARGGRAHAEGNRTTAYGNDTHAEGNRTTALGDNSHIQGKSTNPALGTLTSQGASGLDPVIGVDDDNATIISTWEYYPFSLTKGVASFVSGQDCLALGPNAVACGKQSVAEGDSAIALGNRCFARAAASIALGSNAICFGSNSLSIASASVRISNASLSHYVIDAAEQINPGESYYLREKNSSQLTYTAGARYFLTYITIYDKNNVALAEGRVLDVTVDEFGNFVYHLKSPVALIKADIHHFSLHYGHGSNASYAFSFGPNYANQQGSIALGYGVVSDGAYQTAIGKRNSEVGSDIAFVIGNGDASKAPVLTAGRSNALTVDWSGNIIHQSATQSTTGADYAEYFEWEDGNLNNEDRVGYIVSLRSDKICLAEPNDDILGVVSGTAAVIGDTASWDWAGKYQTDEFGRTIYEEVEEFVNINEDQEIEIDSTSENSVKQSVGTFLHRKLSPDFDDSKEYIPRSKRPEWDTVGLMGKLHVRDDGTCIPGSYLKVGKSGIGTSSLLKTNMRVMKRINDHVVLVFMK